jgi:hypothetical protein
MTLRRFTLLGDGWTMRVRVQDGSGSIVSTLKNDPEMSSHEHAMADVVESLVLSHACADIDVSSEPYITGLQTTIDAMFQ